MNQTLGFIGAGHMAEAVARAAIEHGVLPADQLMAYDPSEERREVFAAMGVVAAGSAAELVGACGQVMLAVKPQVMADAVGGVAHAFNDQHVAISIMAGVSTARLTGVLGRPTRLVRVMPNTPMMVGRGMAGVALGDHARPGDDDLTMRLFSAGQSVAIRVDEAHLDAITAVSGSGPAYLFYLAEAMQRAADELGLGDHARLLVSQTLLGAADLLTRSDHLAAELRRRVTSPGGTTEAAINHMESEHVLDTVVDAIRAAEARSKELDG